MQGNIGQARHSIQIEQHITISNKIKSIKATKCFHTLQATNNMESDNTQLGLFDNIDYFGKRMQYIFLFKRVMVRAESND